MKQKMILSKLQITDEDVTECTQLRNTLDNFKGLQEKPRRNTGAVWTEVRGEKHMERMSKIRSRRVPCTEFKGSIASPDLQDNKKFKKKH